MKFNTKDVYFGYPTYNVASMKASVNEYDFWTTEAEAFVRKDDKYIRINDKKQQELCPFSSDAEDYVTVSELKPIIDLMKDKKEIPEEISGLLVKLYLFKYRMVKNKEKRHVVGFSEQSKRK